MFAQWKANPNYDGSSFNYRNHEPDYQTIKIGANEFELQSYLWQQKGWELVTHFRVGDETTYLCTFKRS